MSEATASTKSTATASSITKGAKSSAAATSSAAAGLITPAKIGIGVGVPLAALLIAALTAAFFILRRRRRGGRKDDTRLNSPIGDYKGGNGAETPLELHEDDVGQVAPAELGSEAAPLSELPAEQGVRVELPEAGGGSGRGWGGGTGPVAELGERTPTAGSAGGRKGGFSLMRRKTPKEGEGMALMQR